MGQAKLKKVLTKDQYGLWHQLLPGPISENGNWISYTHHYTTGSDTLFVTHTRTKKTIAIPKGIKAVFIGETQFVCQQPENVLCRINLQTADAETLPDVGDFKVAQNVLITQSTGRNSVLKIIDNQRTTNIIITSVIQWELNPVQTHVACIVEEAGVYKAILVAVRNGATTTLEQSNLPLHRLQWQPKGFGVAFLKKPDGSTGDRGAVCYYDLKSKRTHRYVLSTGVNLPKTMAVGTFLNVSEDGERVFFYMEDLVQRQDADIKAVQVWNTADKDVYPAKLVTDGWQGYSKVAVWWPESGDCRQLTDNSMPNLMLSGDQRNAITSNPLAYAPQFKKFGDRDYVITDLATGEQQLLLEAYSGNVSDLLASWGGKFVTYYRDGSWWNYNIKSTTHHRLLMPHLPSSTGGSEDPAEYSPLYGSPVWDQSDKAVLVYDAYDVWKVAPDGSSAIRLTHGRETKTVFRLAQQSLIKSAPYNFDGATSEQIDLAKPLFVTAYNETDGNTGIFVLMPGQKERQLTYTDRLITNFTMAADGTHFYFMVQDFDLPPQLVSGSMKGGEPTVVAASNIQQAGYFWGKSELINYEAMGMKMSGILIYPSNFKPDKKYPMVVDIYERQEKKLHVYTLPQLPASTGFNVTNYMLQDYFVFLPTIIPVLGDTGNAALLCLNAAMEKVLENSSIDKDRMGLNGHSYGAFEANFIATQKHPFRTIVSGSGFIDLASDYLHVAWEYDAAGYWMYESGQMRMGKSLYEDRERYYKNSPSLHLERITVSMLIWTGGADRHVDAEQSIRFYMALRRLKKQGVLLVYPDEKHVLSNPKNQQDLWQKMEEWFAFHLKEGPIKPWMQPEYIEK